MTPGALKILRTKVWRLTLEAFGKALDVDERTVRRWESGEGAIPRTIAVLLEAAHKHAWIRNELGIKAEKAHKKGAFAAPRRSPGDQGLETAEIEADPAWNDERRG